MSKPRGPDASEGSDPTVGIGDLGERLVPQALAVDVTERAELYNRGRAAGIPIAVEPPCIEP